MTGKRDRDIDDAFDGAVERILERLFAQADEAEAVVFEMGDGMAEFFLEVAQDQKPDAELIAGLDDVAIDLGEERELEQDDLGDVVFAHDAFDIVAVGRGRGMPSGVCSIGSSVRRPMVRKPISDLRRSQPRICSVFAAVPMRRVFSRRSRLENAAGEERRKVVMREEQSDVEPGDEVEKENARDEGVLRRDEIKDERDDAGEGLAKREPVLAQELVLQEIIFRAVAADGFDRHAENEEEAVNAVAAPGQLAAIGVEGDHDPDAEPEKGGDDEDLAEEEKAVEPFRALRNHGYASRAEVESTRWPRGFNSW